MRAILGSSNKHKAKIIQYFSQLERNKKVISEDFAAVFIFHCLNVIKIVTRFADCVTSI